MDLEHQPDNLAPHSSDGQKLDHGVSSSARPHENSKPSKAAVLDTGDIGQGCQEVACSWDGSARVG